jgi:hypothetical protein
LTVLFERYELFEITLLFQSQNFSHVERSILHYKVVSASEYVIVVGKEFEDKLREKNHRESTDILKAEEAFTTKRKLRQRLQSSEY